jgi:NADP-dependent 3-hydroxy acid dehydrogenase YdfG
VVVGGSAGIGLETARAAGAEGAEVVITGRDPQRLERAATEVGARSTAAFDAVDIGRLERFSPSSQCRSTTCWSPPAVRTTGP